MDQNLLEQSTITTTTEAATPGISGSTPAEQKGNGYSLHQILVDHFSWSGDDKPWNYQPEQRAALDAIVGALSDTLHVAGEARDLQMLVSFDFHQIVKTIRRMLKRNGIYELGAMILIDIIVSEKRFRDLYYCESAADFFHHAEELIGIPGPRARLYQACGRGFREHHNIILKGIGDVPGMKLEVLASGHLTKLSLFDSAVSFLGHESALRLFSGLSYREFAARIKEARSQKTESTTKKASSAALKAKSDQGRRSREYSSKELACARILARNGRVKLITHATEDQVDRSIAALKEHREHVVEENLKELGHLPYNPRKPLEIDESLWKLYNAPEMVERIRLGLAKNAPMRRTIALLLYRLSNESYFRVYWQNPAYGFHFTSFGEFAKTWLGMGEEYRDYIRVGRNLSKFSHLLDGLDGIDTDAMFFKLRYLENAVRTHQGDSALIRARLRGLSVREFAAFASDPDYDLRFSGSLSKKGEEAYLSFVTQINSWLDQGVEVHVVELYGPEESGRLDEYLRRVVAEDMNVRTDEEEAIVSNELHISTNSRRVA